MLRGSSKISQRLVRRQQQPNQIINRGSEKLPHKGEKTMAYITTRKGWEELNNTLVDEETGMTQADWIEWEYDGDIEFID